MTPQESAMLHDLLSKVQRTQLTEKDPNAQRAIEDTIGNNADSLYILAQTVLVQNIALGQARTRIDQLKQQIEEARQHAAPLARASSFLGSLLGHFDPPPPPPPAPVRGQVVPPGPTYNAPPYQPVQGYAPAPGYGSPAGFIPAGMGMGGGFAGGLGGPPSFLRSAATTAAGVAAGALAFEGVESLMHGFGHGGGGLGGGGFGGSGFGGAPVEENIVNNYYDGSGAASSGLGEHHEHRASYDDSTANAGHDGEPRLETAGYDTAGYESMGQNAGSHDIISPDGSPGNASYEPASYDPAIEGPANDPGSYDPGISDAGEDLSSPAADTAFDDSNDNPGDTVGGDTFGGDSYDSGGGDFG